MSSETSTRPTRHEPFTSGPLAMGMIGCCLHPLSRSKPWVILTQVALVCGSASLARL